MSAMIWNQPAAGTAPTAAMPPGMSSKWRSCDGESSWCVGEKSCEQGGGAAGQSAAQAAGRAAQPAQPPRRSGGPQRDAGAQRCAAAAARRAAAAAYVVRADRHAEERDHADAAVLDLDNAAAVERRLVLAKAKRVEDFALGRAAEDRVVDATDQILNRHAHRSARGRAGAQGRALESSRRAEQRKHLKGERKNCQVRVTKNEGG